MRMTHGWFHQACPASRPHAVTIGNFDGVHLGHQAMLARLTARAQEVAAERRRQRPEQTFDDEHKSKGDDEIAHRLGAAAPCGSEKYLKKSDSGEMTRRVSPGFNPCSYACIER